MTSIFHKIARLLGGCAIAVIVISIDVEMTYADSEFGVSPGNRSAKSLGASCSSSNKSNVRSGSTGDVTITSLKLVDEAAQKNDISPFPQVRGDSSQVAPEIATYYVSTEGDDTFAGVQGQPWRTIQKAAAMASAGDIIVVLPGVYNEVVQLENSGTRLAPIKYIGYGAVVDGTGFIDASVFTIKDKSYIDIEGFEIQNSDDMGVAVFSTPGRASIGIRILNNKIHDVANSGVWIEGNKTTPSYSYISGNTVFNTGLGGITLWNNYAGYYVIENNEVYSWQGTGNFDGIQVGDSPYTVVRGNTVHDGGYAHVASDFIDVGGDESLPVSVTHHHLVEDNLVYHTDPGQTHTGAMKFNNRPTYSIMRHNRAYGVQLAFYEQPHKNCTVYNNTVVNTAGHPVQFWNNNIPGVTYKGIVVENNIFGFGAGLFHGQALIDGSPESILMNNNMYRPSSTWYWTGSQIDGYYDVHQSDVEYQRWRVETGQEPENTGIRTMLPIEKLFADATQLDFSPAVGSPAINRASAITATTGAGSGVLLSVENSDYFFDGYDGLTDGDLIQVGLDSIARIVEINETTHEITLDRGISWNQGESVNLVGRSKNIGAI